MRPGEARLLWFGGGGTILASCFLVVTGEYEAVIAWWMAIALLLPPLIWAMRTRYLALTIICYSVFTFLCAFVTNIWQLGIVRLLCGIGIGGEWSMGGTFVAEEWPEDRRKLGAGYMHTGYYVGLFLAAIANYFIGARYGWRVMFMLGGLPALLVGFIRYSVQESAAWRERMTDRHSRPTMGQAFVTLFNATYARRTILNSVFMLVSIVGLWAGSVYVPASVTQIAVRSSYTAADAARLASYGTMLLATGTILGCLALPPLADRLGRRLTLAMYFIVMLLSIAVGFGYVFYLTTHALAWFFVCLFVLGVGGANFAVYTLWLPEQYSTECRASAFAFTTSVGRFVGAGITFLVGAGVSHFGTIGIPVALTSLAFLVGVFLLPFGEETAGKPLPL